MHLKEFIRTNNTAHRQLQQYYDFCTSVRGMSQNTISSKVYVLNAFLNDSKLLDLRKISNQHIYNWIKHQQLRGNSGRSINDRLAHLKAMLRWQQEMNLRMPKLRLGLIPKVAEEPPRKVSFTRSEIQKVLSQANELEWLLIKLSFDCGLRISELRNLKVKHLNGNQLTIFGKGRKRRYAYLCPEAKARLRQWIKQNQPHDYFWPSAINPQQPLATCTLRIYMQRAFLRVGFSDFHPHDLRHSYATDLKLLGVSTREIQAALGHATESVTERYLSDLDGFNLKSVYQTKYKKLNKN